jgi:hypothetical protein
MSGGVAGALVVLVELFVFFAGSALFVVEEVELPLDLQAITEAISKAMSITL